jgi:serine/threonine protein kinase
MLIYE